MTRISNAEKTKYRLVGSDIQCYFCDALAVMDELTPSHKAEQGHKDAFEESWTRTKACRPCWGKLYTANIVQAGSVFEVPLGCMTLEQKQSVINKVAVRTIRKYTVGFEKKFIVPTGIMQLDNGKYAIGSVGIYHEELADLQGALALRYAYMPTESVERALELALSGGNLDLDRVDLYKRILDL